MMDIQLIEKSAFEAKVDGKETSLYTLNSGNGVTIQITNFGGRIVSLWVPDKNGNYEDVVLGRKTIGEYLEPVGERYLGSVIGRFGNRIANGKFELDGVSYTLPVNNGPNSLHGGIKAFDMLVWDVEKVTDNSIELSYLSADGEEGYPGNLKVTMTYTLTPANEVKIEYSATTDKATIVNLTHHSYFNLKGEGNGTAMDHLMTINATEFVPINDVAIPLANIAKVEGTPFDFRKATVIADRIDGDDEQLKNGAGYDHCWVIDGHVEGKAVSAAVVYEPTTGRQMEVLTDQPGVQFYAGNWFDGSGMGKYGKTHKKREGIALETQKYPDTPNRPDFPSARLNPGETYKHVCIYKFSAK